MTKEAFTPEIWFIIRKNLLFFSSIALMLGVCYVLVLILWFVKEALT
ncbi:hypothetical protein IWQ49_006414 [Labrenzia sp. EL_126]|nr:hypothetical protein [Labrenzia sp. EL_126]